jgi:cysteine desulfurase
MTSEPIYLDFHATTPVLAEVQEAMRSADTVFGNPASAHQLGRQARRLLDQTLERSAELLGAHPSQLVVTSGATESNNLAVFGLVGEPPGHVLVSAVEHPSVLEPCRQLARRGYSVEELPVDGAGVIHLAEVERRLRPDTRLVCLQLVNHETGTIQPVAELAQLLAGRAVLHCDAAQAVGKIAVDFRSLGVDTLAVSAHKFHGPKGVGLLLIRDGVRLRPLHRGGHQQRERRPGTEPLPLAVGLTAALEVWQRERDARLDRIRSLRRRFLDGLHSQASPVVLNGPEDSGVPHVLNLSFPGCAANALLIALDLAGVCCSTGSACSSGSLLPSPVLKAMGVSEERLHSAMRFSFSHLLDEATLDEAIRRIARVVERQRSHGIHDADGPPSARA